MRPSIKLLALALLCVVTGRAQTPVTDAGTQAILQVNHQSELARWAESLAKLDQQIQQATAQVNKLTNIQGLIGDAAGTQLPGGSMSALGSMYKSTTSIYRNVNALKTTATGVASGGLSGLYTQQDAINLFEDLVWKYETQGYLKYGTETSAANNADATNEATIKELDQLNDELTSLQQQLNTATTQVQVDKLNGLIASTQSKIAALEARRRAAVDTQTILHYQNQNDEVQRRDKAAEGVAAGVQAAQEKLSASTRNMSAIPGR